MLIVECAVIAAIGVREIQNYWYVVESDAIQLSVVTPAKLDFGRFVLNFITYFF